MSGGKFFAAGEHSQIPTILPPVTGLLVTDMMVNVSLKTSKCASCMYPPACNCCHGRMHDPILNMTASHRPSGPRGEK